MTDTVIGPDISFYQDEPTTPQQVDFEKMKAAGAEFVIIRAGQNKWPDPDFAYNWTKAKAAGLPRGSYWFYDSRVAPKGQADLYIKTVGEDLGELPLFADFEEAYGGQYAGWRKWYDFLERLKTLAGGHEIGIYTAPYYWTHNTLSATSAELNYFKQYPLWIANYQVDTPAIPMPWEEYLFWQTTSNEDGKLYGAESKSIDLNLFNGDVAAFRKRFGLDEPEPAEEPPSDGDPYPVRVTNIIEMSDGRRIESTSWSKGL